MRKVEDARNLPDNCWDIIMEFLPKYYSRSDVLENDILQKSVDGELISGDDDKDIAWVKALEGSAQEELDESNMYLYNEAVEAYDEKFVNVPERNVAFTASVISWNLFDKIRESDNIDEGSMATHDLIAVEALIFIDTHKAVEESSTWEEFCERSGHSDWEEYLLDTIEKKLNLK